jgi:hypothetical protein
VGGCRRACAVDRGSLLLVLVFKKRMSMERERVRRFDGEADERQKGVAETDSDAQ